MCHWASCLSASQALEPCVSPTRALCVCVCVCVCGFALAWLGLCDRPLKERGVTHKCTAWRQKLLTSAQIGSIALCGVCLVCVVLQSSTQTTNPTELDLVFGRARHGWEHHGDKGRVGRPCDRGQSQCRCRHCRPFIGPGDDACCSRHASNGGRVSWSL